MTLTMEMRWGYDGDGPKRGDLLRTNVGNRRERTCIVLRRRRLRTRATVRFKVWAERWWEIEPALRQRLADSASRNGGQRVWSKTSKPGKLKNTSGKDKFEDYMRDGLKNRRAKSSELETR